MMCMYVCMYEVVVWKCKKIPHVQRFSLYTAACLLSFIFLAGDPSPHCIGVSSFWNFLKMFIILPVGSGDDLIRYDRRRSMWAGFVCE
ncbi:hypothetical protein L873DRAFT_1473782 [Choiromyces venosus 120613-1]|uniref:Uncharacterized protein n=1 Tax=Choiromyces venosus 120613-1 TaxID=1336337 RepID=A0A3N4J763_9PEZI|nr:hypothetical protein L873DRAFT_1473782 [Choiromyces venosus 120613-1]